MQSLHDKLFVSNPIYTEKISNIKTKKLMSKRKEKELKDWSKSFDKFGRYKN